MAELFTKLNLFGRDQLLLRNPPVEFEAILPAWPTTLTIVRDWPTPTTIPTPLPTLVMPDALLAFVRTLADVAALAVDLPRFTGDALVWCAYPKQSSRRYRCEFHRDTGWGALQGLGWEGVRQIALDEDWSALRFRRLEYISSLKRDPARRLNPPQSP
jgi:hypothetical protein